MPLLGDPHLIHFLNKPATKKLLVFAHVPPPHHGQAVMVQLLLDGLRRDPAFEIFHVDARVSDDLDDVGGIRVQKIFRLLRFCVEAIRLRLRHGPMDFYYVPAPAKKSAIVRDWVVMFLVRPWFRRTIFHWHAFGLGHWVTNTTEFPSGREQPGIAAPTVFGGLESLARKLTHVVMGRAGLSIVLTDYNRTDAELLRPRRIETVPNGLPDPAPNFADEILPERLRRFHARQAAPTAGEDILHCLFLGHCMESKGLHDAARMVAEYRTKAPVHLFVAGSFPSAADRKGFEALIEELSLRDAVTILGFADDAAKKRHLARADVLLFPTRYSGETFGLVVAEALAFGLPCVVTQWRGVPSLLPAEDLDPILPGDAVGGAQQIQRAGNFRDFAALRQHFLQHFSGQAHLQRLAEVLR